MSGQDYFKWTNEIVQAMLDLAKTHNLKKTTKLLNKQFGTNIGYNSVRAKYNRENKALRVSDKIDIEPKKQYGFKKKKNNDGTLDLDQLIEVYSNNDLKDDEFVVRAHGFDDSAWGLVSHDFSMWNHFNKELVKPKTLYASKVKLRPKVVKLSDSKLLKAILAETKPIELNITKHKTTDKWMLEIPLMDLHFGINTLDNYKQTLIETIEIINKRLWDEVIITFGSDLMHVDNLNNTTANQTRLQDVDHVKMIEDVKAFYEQLVKSAARQSNHVDVIYIKGNHDQTTSGLLVHWLDGRFKEVGNVTVDYSIEEIKVRQWEQVFLALSHGDKGGKRRKNTMATKYPLEWSKSKVRELHTGHIHHETAIDEFGIMERSLPTGAKTDQYHKDNSFEGAHQRFMLFEYSEDRLRGIYYV